MYKKLTITVDELVYKGLYETIGPGKISSFINNLIRPYVVKRDLKAGYRQMAKDEEREKEAEAWSENFLNDF